MNLNHDYHLLGDYFEKKENERRAKLEIKRQACYTQVEALRKEYLDALEYLGSQSVRYTDALLERIAQGDVEGAIRAIGPNAVYADALYLMGVEVKAALMEPKVGNDVIDVINEIHNKALSRLLAPRMVEGMPTLIAQGAVTKANEASVAFVKEITIVFLAKAHEILINNLDVFTDDQRIRNNEARKKENGDDDSVKPTASWESV